jgi:Tfp pilus assembly protein FimT
MGYATQLSIRQRSRLSGFSVIELMIVVLVAGLLIGISIPGFIKSWRMYRLSNAASQIANELDLLRFTAVRRNTTLNLYGVPRGANTVLFIDSNKNQQQDATEPSLLIPTDMQMMNGQAGVPNTASMGAAYAVTFTPTIGTGAGSGITFGPGGTVTYTGASAPYAIVLGYPASPQDGYRAITVTPMGEIKVWTWSGNGWVPTS